MSEAMKYTNKNRVGMRTRNISRQHQMISVIHFSHYRSPLTAITTFPCLIRLTFSRLSSLYPYPSLFPLQASVSAPSAVL